MRAVYDSEAHAMYIDVVDPPHCDDNWVIDSAADQLFLHVDDHDRIVGIEVLDADDVDTALLRRFVGTRGLDADQVIAAHAAALRAQDQAVTLVFDRLYAA